MFYYYMEGSSLSFLACTTRSA